MKIPFIKKGWQHFCTFELCSTHVGCMFALRSVCVCVHAYFSTVFSLAFLYASWIRHDYMG